MRKRLVRIDEPSAADLASIDDEMPLINADLDVLDAEIALLYATDRGGPTAMDWRRLRRAEARATRAAAALAVRTDTTHVHVCNPLRLQEGRMSDCRYGCKVMTCPHCGAESVVHFATYGCPDGRRQVVELLPATGPTSRRAVA